MIIQHSTTDAAMNVKHRTMQWERREKQRKIPQQLWVSDLTALLMMTPWYWRWSVTVLTRVSTLFVHLHWFLPSTNDHQTTEKNARGVYFRKCVFMCILRMFKHKDSAKCIDICEWEFVVENGNCRRQGETDKTGWLEWGAATTECPVFIRTHQLTLVKLSCMTANMTASWPDNTRCKNIYQVFFIESLL